MSLKSDSGVVMGGNGEEKGVSRTLTVAPVSPLPLTREDGRFIAVIPDCRQRLASDRKGEARAE